MDKETDFGALIITVGVKTAKFTNYLVENTEMSTRKWFAYSTIILGTVQLYIEH